MRQYIQLNLLFVFIFVGVLGLAACGADAQPVRGVSTDIVIIYQREGGVTGISWEWSIYPDGRIVGPGGQEFQAPPEEVIALLAKIEALSSSVAQESLIYEDSCCDQFTYTIITQVGDQQTRIQTNDGSKHPQELSTILSDIKGLISRADMIE